MKRFGLFCVLVTGSMLLAPTFAGETFCDKCRTEDAIIVFAKYFDIDGKSQKAIGDPGRFIVLKKGQSFKNWKLDQDRWRWHCGTGRDKWTGKIAEAIEDITQIPAFGSAVTGIFGNWEAARSKGATRVDIEYKTDGTVVWTSH